MLTCHEPEWGRGGVVLREASDVEARRPFQPDLMQHAAQRVEQLHAVRLRLIIDIGEKEGTHTDAWD